MKHKFYGEPNLQVTVRMESFLLQFDANGEMVLSDDHPALERMKTHYRHEAIEQAEDTGDDAQVPCFPCPHCDFEAATKSGLSAHIRAKHKEKE